jgi:hypothetical protein
MRCGASAAVLRPRPGCGGRFHRVGLTPRSPRHVSRREREQRAYRLAMIGSGAGLVGVVGIVLAIVGVVGAWLPIVAIIVAILCTVGFRRTVSSR